MLFRRNKEVLLPSVKATGLTNELRNWLASKTVLLYNSPSGLKFYLLLVIIVKMAEVILFYYHLSVFFN